MLFDFQSSKFTLRLRPDEMGSVLPTTAKVAEALWNHRTKLNATLARMRVERDANCISQLISNPAIRKTYEANQLYPCYARVNSIKVRDVQTEVVNQLLNAGFMLVDDESDLGKYSYRSVCVLQKDLLAFSTGCRGTLDTHELVESGCLVLQVSILRVSGVNSSKEVITKNNCGVILSLDRMFRVTDLWMEFGTKLSCVLEILWSLRPIQVFLYTNSTSLLKLANVSLPAGVEVAHIATLLGYRGTVLVYNTQPTDIEQIQQRLLSLEVRSILNP